MLHFNPEKVLPMAVAPVQRWTSRWRCWEGCTTLYALIKTTKCTMCTRSKNVCVMLKVTVERFLRPKRGGRSSTSYHHQSRSVSGYSRESGPGCSSIQQTCWCPSNAWSTGSSSETGLWTIKEERSEHKGDDRKSIRQFRRSSPNRSKRRSNSPQGRPEVSLAAPR